jgi:hypothetical protein
MIRVRTSHFSFAVAALLSIGSLLYLIFPGSFYAYPLLLINSILLGVLFFIFCMTGMLYFQKSKLNIAKLPNWPLFILLIPLFFLLGSLELHYCVVELNKWIKYLANEHARNLQSESALIFIYLLVIIKDAEKILVFFLFAGIYYFVFGRLLLFIKKLIKYLLKNYLSK